MGHLGPAVLVMRAETSRLELNYRHFPQILLCSSSPSLRPGAAVPARHGDASGAGAQDHEHCCGQGDKAKGNTGLTASSGRRVPSQFKMSL